MANLKERLVAQHARALEWKTKRQALKQRYGGLKQKWLALKESQLSVGDGAAPYDSKALVSRCYGEMLGREPSLEELDHGEGFPAMLDTKLWTQEQVMWAIIQCQEFKVRVHQAEFVPPGHFYSAIPNAGDRMPAMARNLSPTPLPIEMNPGAQARLLRSFLNYRDDFPFQADASAHLPATQSLNYQFEAGAPGGLGVRTSATTGTGAALQAHNIEAQDAWSRATSEVNGFERRLPFAVQGNALGA